MHTTEYKRGRWAEEEIAQKRWGGGVSVTSAFLKACCWCDRCCCGQRGSKRGMAQLVQQHRGI